MVVSPHEFERRFANELLPWQLSHQRNHFDQGFVDWIYRRYLPIALSKDASEIERWQAIQWINKAKFSEERREDALLQWDCYQAEQIKREDAEVSRAEKAQAEASEDFDPNSEAAIAARARVREALRRSGLL
jgi:hypothetical protein